MEKQVLSIAEACQALCCGRSKLYELISSGKLKAAHLGRKIIISAAEVQRFLGDLPAYDAKATSRKSK